MLAATKVKICGSEKKKMNKKTYDIPSIKRVTRMFLEVVQNDGKEMYKTSVLHVQSCFFAILDILLFFSPFSLPSPLSITRFYILFWQTIKIIESFAF